MKKVLSGLLLLFLSACGLLKQNSKITEDDLEKANAIDKREVNTVIDKQKNSALLLARTDALAADYLIRIWPKGLFHFSPSGQIYAEADSVLISGNQRWSGSQSQMQQINQRENIRVAEKVLNMENHETRKIRTEKVKKPLTKLVVGLVIAVFLLIFMIIRKYFLVNSG